MIINKEIKKGNWKKGKKKWLDWGSIPGPYRHFEAEKPLCERYVITNYTIQPILSSKFWAVDLMPLGRYMWKQYIIDI